MALTVAEIETAIKEVLEKGQSGTTDGVSWTAARLPELQALLESTRASTAANGFGFRMRPQRPPEH